MALAEQLSSACAISHVLLVLMGNARCRFQQSSDDAGPAGFLQECPELTDRNEIYLGQCGNGTDITSGLRYTEVGFPAIDDQQRGP